MHWVSFSTPLRDTQKHPVIMTQVGSQFMQAHSHRDRSRIHPNDSVVWENGTSFTKEKEKKKTELFLRDSTVCQNAHSILCRTEIIQWQSLLIHKLGQADKSTQKASTLSKGLSVSGWISITIFCHALDAKSYSASATPAAWNQNLNRPFHTVHGIVWHINLHEKRTNRVDGFKLE